MTMPSPNTIEMINLALKSDKGVTAEERKTFLKILQDTHGGESPDRIGRIFTRQEVATLARKTTKWVDYVAKKHPDLLVRVRLPGATRASGFTESSVRNLLEAAR